MCDVKKSTLPFPSSTKSANPSLLACFTIWFPIVLDLQMNNRHETRPVKFTLATILADPSGFQSVAAFLKLEFSAENVYFYQRVEEYRDPVNRGEGAAEYLYDTFIAPSSPFQVLFFFFFV